MATDEKKILTEDGIYRLSSQYRLWTFTPTALLATRTETNRLAAERVKTVLGQPVETMTVDEELLLVRRYCHKALQLMDYTGYDLSPAVRVSTLQFIKRFYVGASCMEYPPAKMVASAIFMGAKANGISIKLAHLARKASRTEEEITAPEFKLIQGIRFALDVRTPYRALEGGLMVLLEIGHGRVPDRGAELQKEMLQKYGPDWEGKVQALVEKTRGVLARAAVLSDAYFLYTPPQIWLGALCSVDEWLASLYLELALSGTAADQREQIVAQVRACAELLAHDEDLNKRVAEEGKALEAKLKGCTNPETSDLVELNAAQKRDPDPNSASGNASKKLKTQNGAVEDPFGPSLVKTEPK